MKERVHYFDMLKGLAIFMVVMGHVLTMCIRDIDCAATFKLIGEIHMPLFFFISGWLCYKDVGGKSVQPNLWRRAKQLLVPMVVVSTLWIWRFPYTGLESPFNSTFSGLWSDIWKNGYWFTLVLMEIILLYTAILPILNLCRTFVAECISVTIMWVILLIVSFYLPSVINSYLSFSLAAQFYVCFMARLLAHRHQVDFSRVVANGTVVTVSLLTTIFLLYYICWYWEFPAIPVWCIGPARGIMHIALAIKVMLYN